MLRGEAVADGAAGKSCSLDEFGNDGTLRLWVDRFDSRFSKSIEGASIDVDNRHLVLDVPIDILEFLTLRRISRGLFCARPRLIAHQFNSDIRNGGDGILLISTTQQAYRTINNVANITVLGLRCWKNCLADADGTLEFTLSQRSLVDGGKRCVLVNARKTQPELLDERGKLMAVKRGHHDGVKNEDMESGMSDIMPLLS